MLFGCIVCMFMYNKLLLPSCRLGPVRYEKPREEALKATEEKILSLNARPFENRKPRNRSDQSTSALPGRDKVIEGIEVMILLFLPFSSAIDSGQLNLKGDATETRKTQWKTHRTNEYHGSGPPQEL